MKYRRLGRSGLNVSELVLGTMNFGGPTEKDEATRIIDSAIDAGVNLFDCADIYAGGESERILGEARSMEDLGPCFTGDLTGAEVRYLVAHEWAETAEDVLYRRSKLGLSATPQEGERLGQFMAELAGKTVTVFGG